MTMIAVGSNDMVLVFAGGNSADSDGFLSIVQVQEAFDFALELVHLITAFFKTPDENHLTVPIE
jgi:hypothetical protein